MTWTKDTQASVLLHHHRAHLARVAHKVLRRGCPGLDWLHEQVTKRPDLTFEEALDLGERDISEGKASSAWLLDVYMAHHRRMYPEMRLHILRILAPRDVTKAAGQMRYFTDAELAIISARGG